MHNQKYKWTVIGAGPAGIAVVSKLLDFGMNSKDLLWIDPLFKVGDFGKYWGNVSSNTKVQTFINYLNSIKFYVNSGKQDNFAIHEFNEEDTCQLKHISDPLIFITENIRPMVASYCGQVAKIKHVNNAWTLEGENFIYFSEKVVLAIGLRPKQLNYSKPHLDFKCAIDKEKLKNKIDTNQAVAVFGSSHSAFIIIRNLVELGVKRIVNFYQSPCRYAVDIGEWVLFDNTGLKGETAVWVRENIDGVLPKNLERYLNSKENIEKYLPEVDKVVYAVGFESRKNITVGDFVDLQYNPHLGILAPGLFGIGIAYPELKSDPFGNFEYQIGIWKFAQYLDKIFPLWVKL